MKLGRLVPPVAILVAFALAACSGDEGPAAVEPPVEPTIGATTTATTESPGEVVLPTVAATDAVEPAVEEESARADPAPMTTLPPESSPPLPTVAFPDDVALLGHHWAPTGTDRGATDFVRIYRNKDGEVVRETLFAAPDRFRECRDADISFADLQEEFGEERAYEEWIRPYYSVDYSDIQALAGQLPECGGSYLPEMMAKPDASSIIMTVCVEPDCDSHLYPASSDHWPPPGRTALYESKDGGITWEKLAVFDVPWIPGWHLPAEDGESRLLLTAERPFSKDVKGRYTEGPLGLLWSSSGGAEELPDPPPEPAGYRLGRSFTYLDDGRFAWSMHRENHWLYLAEGGEDVTDLVQEQRECQECLPFPDGRLFHWWQLRDPETGEQWSVRKPPDVLTFLPLAVQRGPFLRVTNVAGCLPVRAEASADSEELACSAERVLLTDLAEATEADGTTWHRVRTPAGLEGWADVRYLE